MSFLDRKLSEKDSHLSDGINMIDHFNPIKRINKGFKKGKLNHEETPMQINKYKELPQTTKQLRFSSLSKNKDIRQLSEAKANLFLRNKQTQISSDSFSKQRNYTYFRDIARKISFDKTSDSSKEKGLNFSDIIKQSKQKKHAQASLSKYNKPPLIKKPQSKAVEKSFNKLKTKLIGQKISDKENRNTANNRQEVLSFILPQKKCLIEQNEKVRISTEFFLDQINNQLNMDPTL